MEKKEQYFLSEARYIIGKLNIHELKKCHTSPVGCCGLPPFHTLPGCEDMFLASVPSGVCLVEGRGGKVQGKFWLNKRVFILEGISLSEPGL